MDKPKDWGYKQDNAYILEKVPPPSLILLRNELAMFYNADISAATQKGRDFEECIGILAAHLDIVLDGDYEPASLFEMLYEALRNRHSNKNQPHLRAAGLQNVEIIEREGAISLEPGVGTIAPSKEDARTPEVETEANVTVYYCNWPHCEKVLKPDTIMCPRHWHFVPAKLRAKALKFMRLRGELIGEKVPEFRKVLDEIAYWVLNVSLEYRKDVQRRIRHQAANATEHSVAVINKTKH